MRRRCGVDDERLRVADVGEVACEVDVLDECLTDRAAALHLEAEHRSGTLREVLQGAVVVRMAGQARPEHALDAGVGVEPLRDDAGVVDVGLDAVRQRLDALREQECRVRRERGADVAQLLGAEPREERVLAEVARPLEASVARHGLAEERELLRVPVEATGLDDHAAERGAVPAEELRRGVRDDVGAPLDRAVQVRRRDRGVDDEGDAVRVRDIGEGLEVGDLTRGVRDRLDEERLRLVGDGRSVVGGVGRLHERRLDAEASKRDVELRDRTAVEVRRGDDVVTGAREAREGDVLRRQAARGGDGAEAALEARDALLEARDGRVREARVDVAVLLQGESRRRVSRVVEDERARLVDRQRTGARHLVGDVARVDGAGLEAVFAVCHARNATAGRSGIGPSA